tara:strand:- start:28603 stop:28968 length:366 start_codon:yes stop_codon:yes gene_type:complete
MTTAQNGPLEVPEIGIRIPIGETVVVQGVSLSFVEVLEDSRCPEDVTCVWAGRARIAVRVKAPGREPESKMLIFGEVQGDESDDLTLYDKDGIRLIGLQLVPYPKTSTEGLAYVLLVKKDM